MGIGNWQPEQTEGLIRFVYIALTDLVGIHEWDLDDDDQNTRALAEALEQLKFDIDACIPLSFKFRNYEYDCKYELLANNKLHAICLTHWANDVIIIVKTSEMTDTELIGLANSKVNQVADKLFDKLKARGYLLRVPTTSWTSKVY